MTVLDYNRIFSVRRRKVRRSTPRITQDIYRRAAAYSLKSKRAKLSVISKLKAIQSNRRQYNEVESVPCKAPIYSQDYNQCVTPANTTIESTTGHCGQFASVQCLNSQMVDATSFYASTSNNDDYFYDPRFPVLSFLLNEPDGYLPPYMTNTAFPNVPQQMQDYYAGQINPGYQSHPQW
ncbi:hypothetical protein Aperf_G00000103357 [Anoplocephala perfoliata]